jgi:tight adherence protein C
MEWSLLIAVVLVFVAVAALGIWVGGGIIRARTASTSSRLALYGRGSLRDGSMREQTLRRPMVERAIAPIFLGAGRAMGRFTPTGFARRTQRKLVLAGLSRSLDPNAWVVVKVVSVLVGLGIAALAVTRVDGVLGLVMAALAIFAGILLPDAWLQRRIEGRRTAMRNSLPDVLDLLVISVEAGLGFDSALARVVATVPGPLSEEFFRMLQETRVGVSRRDAMRHLLDRTDVDELRSFLLAMLQAEAFGVSMSRVLRIQADEIRNKRRQRAQQKAFGAPVKMVFPLVVCIFPALLVVLLGPAMLSIFDAFGGL